MKHRVIPIILIDGNTVVKGEKFNNWRTVGSIQATANLFSARDVDELILLDVGARKLGKSISPKIVEVFANTLRVPFAVGGGVNDFNTASDLLSAGAEKIVIGTSAFEKPDLIYDLANTFGNQAVSVTLDLVGMGNYHLKIRSGKQFVEIDSIDFAKEIVKKGAGEIILQSIARDGTRTGMDLESITLFSSVLEVPLVASSGAGTFSDFLSAIKAGASAVAAGAIFQFTEITPLAVKQFLIESGVPVRQI